MAKISKPPLSLPSFSSFGDARQAVSQAFGNLQNWIVSILPVTDYSGSRISNVAPPQDADDVVTLRYLQAVIIPAQSLPYQAAKTGLAVVGGLGSGGPLSPLTTKGDVYVFGTSNSRLPVGTNGQVLAGNSSVSLGLDWETPSVSLSAPAEFTVSGSPVGLAGTLTFTKSNQSSGLVYAGPVSGSPAQPVFRALVTSDIPLAAESDLTAQTAPATLATYTPGSAGTYRAGGYITITVVSVDILQLQLQWTDETSTVRTVTLTPNGAGSPNLSTTGVFLFSPVDIRVKAATVITLSTILAVGGGSVTYDAGGSIIQIS